MKKKFSNKWKASGQIRKQRKYKYNAALHIKHKMLAANLSKELRKKYSKRSFPLRKGDTVIIRKGEFKKKKGKISNINMHSLKIYIDGVQRSRRDGTKVEVPFYPSNLQIIELNLDDKKRLSALEKKGHKNKQKEK